MNEKYALCYNGCEWKVVDKDELAELLKSSGFSYGC
jgi:hypothetical protein